MAPLLIETIFISPRVNAKINQIHNLTSLDVEDACDHRISTRWGLNEEGVARLLLLGELESGRRIRVVLYPTAVAGEWNLATAFPVQ